MPTCIIKQKISIKPSLLTANIRKNILATIRDRLEDTCTKEYGYILTVHELTAIHNNYISTVSPDTIFDVECEIEYLKPEIGKDYEGQVMMIFQHGVFVEVEGKLKVLIPTTNTNGFEFDKISGTYKKEKEEIQVGDRVNVEVVNIRYEKQNYDGIGKLI